MSLSECSLSYAVQVSAHLAVLPSLYAMARLGDGAMLGCSAATLVTSVLYHLCEVMNNKSCFSGRSNVRLFGMTDGNWHRLDNVFAITSLQLLCLYLSDLPLRKHYKVLFKKSFFCFVFDSARKGMCQLVGGVCDARFSGARSLGHVEHRAPSGPICYACVWSSVVLWGRQAGRAALVRLRRVVVDCCSLLFLQGFGRHARLFAVVARLLACLCHSGRLLLLTREMDHRTQTTMTKHTHALKNNKLNLSLLLMLIFWPFFLRMPLLRRRLRCLRGWSS